MADLLDLLGDNSNNPPKDKPPREKGFLSGLRRSGVENTDSSLKKSQSSNNFMFEMESDKKGLVIDQQPDDTSSFVFRRGTTRRVNITNIDTR